MLRIRTVKTASGSVAVQVIYYFGGKRVIFKHVGSARNERELIDLKLVAQDFIDGSSPRLPIDDDASQGSIFHVDKVDFLGVYHTFSHQVLSNVLSGFGFPLSENGFLRDLVIMRIFEPASKLRSIELLKTHFGIDRNRNEFYRSVHAWLGLKSNVEQKAMEFAGIRYGFDFELVFYDVTTLYFETFDADEFRKPGFSKDNKPQQPQILVALLVTPEGFPLGYEVFSGNTFEGHTIIPVIKSFAEKYKSGRITVVADAAMISQANVDTLSREGIHYIVGARLGNLPQGLVQTIDTQLVRENGHTIRIPTGKGYLICSFSGTRYRKDKYEMEKQIQRAEELIGNPGKIKRVKFLKTDDGNPKLNTDLIERTSRLLGVKGYYTDLAESVANNENVIERYSDLYKIEQAFRLAKSDLQTRPIFHYKEEPHQITPAYLFHGFGRIKTHRACNRSVNQEVHDGDQEGNRCQDPQQNHPKGSENKSKDEPDTPRFGAKIKSTALIGTSQVVR